MKYKLVVTKEYKGTPRYIESWYEENQDTEENHL
jgi:hypothetical protein